MFTDWLGQEVAVGDTIVYAAMSGRSVTMVLAKVVSFNESGSITVQPLQSSRWKQHYGRTRYIDTRTGKGIDPFATDKHTAEPSYCRHKQTGERLSAEDINNGRLGYLDYEYVPAVWKDYVEQVKEPTSKVTLTVTANVTKWTGATPES